LDQERARSSNSASMSARAHDHASGTPGSPNRARRLQFDLINKENSTLASGKSDELKGRIKEATGVLIGDKKLEREGQTDQVVGKVKQNVEKVIDKVKDAVDGTEKSAKT
ncbi:MAG: CsbD family protein, partial [Myxococcota bacterium]